MDRTAENPKGSARTRQPFCLTLGLEYCHDSMPTERVGPAALLTRQEPHCGWLPKTSIESTRSAARWLFERFPQATMKRGPGASVVLSMEAIAHHLLWRS